MRSAGKGSARGTLEVHEHCYTSGPLSNRVGPDGGANKFTHSHEGGDKPHKHEHCGPASYVIDKDDWFRATGLRGGGRKTFTVAPKGLQLPIADLEDWQKTFEVIVDEESCAKFIADGGGKAEGAGIGPAARMVLAAKMKPLFPGLPPRRRVA